MAEVTDQSGVVNVSHLYCNKCIQKEGERFRVIKYDGIDYMKIKKSKMQKCNVGSLTDGTNRSQGFS